MKFATLFKLSATLLVMVFVFAGCQDKPANSTIKAVASYEMFQQLITSSGNRLLVFEMYADWCAPCKVLAPILEEVAVEYKDKADIYKVDVVKLPKIADMFGVEGIPFVAFVKNKKNRISLSGLRKKADYQRALRELTADFKSPTPGSPQPANPEQPTPAAQQQPTPAAQQQPTPTAQQQPTPTAQQQPTPAQQQPTPDNRS